MSDLFINYATNNNNNKIYYLNQRCFSEVFYKPKMEKIITYIPLERIYREKHSEFSPLSPKTIFWFIEKLKNIGIECFVSFVNSALEKEKTELKGKILKITWKSNKNNSYLFKVVFTLIRYTYEKDFSNQINDIYNTNPFMSWGNIMKKLSADREYLYPGHSLFFCSRDIITHEKEMKFINTHYNHYPFMSVNQTFTKNINSDRRIYCMGDTKYAEWLKNYMYVEIVSDIDKCDIVLFTGGEDVTPSFYEEPSHPHTCSNISRDENEKKIFEIARKSNKKMLGICRGSQFLCVMNGGKLIQDINNHCGDHSIILNWKWFKNKKIVVSSTHHQIMYPYNLLSSQYNIIGYANKCTSYNGIPTNSSVPVCGKFKEPEIVFFPHTKCLCIQSHPEIMQKDKNQEAIASIIHWFLYSKIEQ